jgi:MFS family permease
MSVADPAAGQSAAPAKLSPGKVSYALGFLLVIYTLNFVDRQIVAVLGEDIIRDLKLDDFQYSLLGGLVFALFYTVLGIPIARMAERGDRVLIISICLAIWSGFTALCGIAFGNVNMVLLFGWTLGFWQILVFRIGVGVGEAGCTPPAHSLISDYADPAKRASALAIYSMGVPIGTMLGFGLGALVADGWDTIRVDPVAQWAGFYGWLHTLLLPIVDIATVPGWRMAFLVVGLPGVILAIMAWMTLPEPRRIAGVKKVAPSASTAPSLSEALKELAATPSYAWAVLAATVISFLGYGHAYFFGSFLSRAHEMGLAERGMALAVMIGVAGVIGTWLGGQIADAAAKRDTRAYMSVPAVAFALGAPFFIAGMFLPKGVIATPFGDISSAYGTLALLAVPTLLNSIWYGPVYASVQGLVRPRTRATAVAIMLFVVNLVGLGLGPTVVGALSVHFGGQHFASLGFQAAEFAGTCRKLAADAGPDLAAACAASGAEGLRLSLVATSAVGLFALFCFIMARRTIREDLARVQAAA